MKELERWTQFGNTDWGHAFFKRKNFGKSKMGAAISAITTQATYAKKNRTLV